MADRRIDQLTEAEDISDDDLFVIWKQNISQTRSIAKRTMNLATKSYVDSRSPNWDNAGTITAAQLQSGYVCPDDGIVVGTGWTTSTGTHFFLINDIRAGSYWQSGGNYSFLNVQCQINKGDILRTSSELSSCYFSFVPFKTHS